MRELDRVFQGRAVSPVDEAFCARHHQLAVIARLEGISILQVLYSYPFCGEIRLFEFERNWLSPVIAVWDGVMNLLENHALVTGISLAVTPIQE